jgi:putative endonuclease
MSTTEIGKKREAEGLLWLQLQIRIRVLAKNYRCKSGEIDLILEHQISPEELDLVFVEIRTRENSDFISPIETIRPHKIRKIRRVSEQFLTTYKGGAGSVRFDVLTFEKDRWEHWRGAF